MSRRAHLGGPHRRAPRLRPLATACPRLSAVLPSSGAAFGLGRLPLAQQAIAAVGTDLFASTLVV